MLVMASSVWAAEQHCREFAWQEGYAVFSVSNSMLATVGRYIEGQEEHHGRQSFHEELALLLDRHGLSWDAKYFP